MNLIAKTEEQRQIATSRLNRYISEGGARATGLLQRMERDVPTDYIAPASRVRFSPTDGGSVRMQVVEADGESVKMAANLHRHAMGQLAEQCSMRMEYVNHLLEQGDWGRELLARNLEDGIKFGNGTSRYLVRQAGDSVRAVLSSKFRRIDARPILEMLVNEADRAGAIMVDGTASDIRVEAKFIVPQVMEPAPGEFMVFGFAWSNSDFGAGANSIRAFALRLMCFNGATLEQSLRQIHLGRQLSEDVEWSAKTLRLDTETAASAARDTARTLLSGAKIAQTAGLITAASTKGIDAKAALDGLKKKLGVGQAKAVVEAYNSPDVVELPPGNTLWRFSNAISLVARNTQEAEDKLALERLAGDVLKAA